MSIDYYQKGKMKTVVTLNLIGESLNTSGGRYTMRPLEKVTVSDTHKDIFQCTNCGSSICGPEGHVEYESSDGSVFKLDFDCPVTKDNYCSGSVSKNSPFKISSSVQAGGADIDYTWTITQKDFNNFIDMPVSSIDLLNAEKCKLLSVGKILEYINNREFVCMKDVLAIKDMPMDAKLWCIKNDLFFTSQTKAIITRAIADKVKDQFAANEVSGLFEQAYEHNIIISQGIHADNQGKELRSDIRSFLRSNVFNKNGVGADMSLAVVDALCDENLAKGCSNAIDLYVASDDSDKRKQEIVSIIEDLL